MSKTLDIVAFDDKPNRAKDGVHDNVIKCDSCGLPSSFQVEADNMTHFTLCAHHAKKYEKALTDSKYTITAAPVPAHTFVK